jgi:hypothetical protein
MKDSTIWVGIDDHADSVKVSVFWVEWGGYRAIRAGARHWAGLLKNAPQKGGIRSLGGERYGGPRVPASKGEPSRQLCGRGNPNPRS